MDQKMLCELYRNTVGVELSDQQCKRLNDDGWFDEAIKTSSITPLIRGITEYQQEEENQKLTSKQCIQEIETVKDIHSGVDIVDFIKAKDEYFFALARSFDCVKCFRRDILNDKLLSTESATRFFTSPITPILSAEQFRLWDIPIVDNDITLGMPVGKKTRSNVPLVYNNLMSSMPLVYDNITLSISTLNDIPIAVLNADNNTTSGVSTAYNIIRLGVNGKKFSPRHHKKYNRESFSFVDETTGRTFVVRAPQQSITIDGYCYLPHICPPDFPSHSRAISIEEAIIAYNVENGIEVDHINPCYDRIKSRLNNEKNMLLNSRDEPCDYNHNFKYQALVKRGKYIEDEEADEWTDDTEDKEADEQIDDTEYIFLSGKSIDISVWPGSVLDKLRILSEDLAYEFLLPASAFSWFILTDKIPFISPIQADAKYIKISDFSDAQISITASPHANWRAVANTFRDFQIRALKGKDNRKPETLSMEVFCFVTRYFGTNISDAQWSDILKLWNDEHPDKKQFKYQSRLISTYIRAKDKITKLPRYS